MLYALHRSSAYFPSVTGARSVISTERKAQDARCNMCTVGDLSCRHRYTVEECVEREVRSRIVVHAARCSASRRAGTPGTDICAGLPRWAVRSAAYTTPSQLDQLHALAFLNRSLPQDACQPEESSAACSIA